MAEEKSGGKFSAIFPLLETVCIVVSVCLGYVLSRKYNIVPRSLVVIPDVYVGFGDLIKIIYIFSISHFLVFLAMQSYRGPNRFDSARRFASEYLAFLIAFTFSSLYMFLATTINYDPQLIAAIGVLATVFFLLWFSLRGAWASPAKPAAFFSHFGRASGSILRSFATVKGALILFFFFLPSLLAFAFISNRDAANLITQVRIRLGDTHSEGEWGLVNALGSMVFDSPMLAKLSPHGKSDLYVLERKGRLLRVPYPEAGEKETVLDISKKVGEVEAENGALGFAFHPEFGKPGSDKAGFLYLYYTDVRGGRQVNRISRFDLSGGTREAIAASELPLMVLRRHSDWHNGGSLEFGPDGFLYVALGEGVKTQEFHLLREVLRQGIMRIDVDQRGSEASHPIVRQPANGKTENYFIPNDNPFLGDTGILEEFWATGFRNPFRISFDPETGDLWAGDVGTTVWEEVNKVEKGMNYQYPFIEGRNEAGAPRPDRIFGAERGPVYTYEHTSFDRAVIGGVVYRGAKHGALRGKYIFADSYSSKIFMMETGSASVDAVRLIARGGEFAQRGISSVTEISTGDILVTLLGAESPPGGMVLRLVHGKGMAPVTRDPNAGQTASRYSVEAAKNLFIVNCGRCHGTHGTGDGPDAEVLKVKLPDFSSPGFQDTRTDQHIRAVIFNGGAAQGLSPLMPPWGQLLKPEEIDFMVKYVRELGKTR